MSIKIALAGNPNCGKTTMFNDLTGSSQYVGNWPGVTVEKKEGKLRGQKDVIITDLPGIYSLSPYTLEEVVTRNYIMDERPDVVVNLVDASNIERNLYLTTQLTEMGIPVLIALNMMDIVKKNGDRIDTKKLSEQLGCEIIETSAVKGEGLKALADCAVKMARSGVKTTPQHTFDQRVEQALSEIASLISDVVPAESLRWYSVKLFERDEKAMERFSFAADTKEHLEQIIAGCEKQFDDDSESIITNERYQYIGTLMQSCVHKKKSGMTTSDKIDQIVTNRILALPIFAVVMYIVYFVSVSWLGTIVTDWTNDTLFAETIQPAVAGVLESIGAAAWLEGLIVDGIIGGVGAVLGFVPQMFILFFFLSILEDCGYMARVAFIMDRIFRRFGLSGKSFIPMLISSGCGVPGVMATRTIENEKDRRMTIMTTTFIPCGAKVPFIGMIAGAIFGGSAWVATSAYFVGMAAIILSGIMLKKTKMFSGDPAPFVMELPAYHLPTVKNVLRSMWERGWSFIKKAGTVILLATILIWFLQGFGFENGFGMVEDINHSILAKLGGIIAPVFAPLGWGDWKATVAAITGLIAKEEVVNTFGVLYQYAGEADLMDDASGIYAAIGADFGAMAAYSFMIFNLLCAPCFAAMGAIKREMNNAKWTLGAIGYMCGFAYVVSLIVFQIGGLFTGEATLGIGTIAAVVLLAGIVYLLFRKGYQGETEHHHLSSVAAAAR